MQHAVSTGRAVVALESTSISHGMPYPQNVPTALQVEEEVSQHGAVPVTVATVHVGWRALLGERGASRSSRDHSPACSQICSRRMGPTTRSGKLSVPA